MGAPKNGRKPATDNDGFSKGFNDHCGRDQEDRNPRSDHPQGLPDPRYRHNATGGTSEAAALVARKTAGGIAAKILAVIKDTGRAMSAEDVQAVLKPLGVMSPVQTYRARLTDLAQAGYLRDSGQRGKSEAGCGTVRWELVPEASA